jgi:hypothetical protein
MNSVGKPDAANLRVRYDERKGNGQLAEAQRRRAVPRLYKTRYQRDCSSDPAAGGGALVRPNVFSI